MAHLDYEEIQVECHSGYKANEYPVAFTFQGCRWEVSEIVDRWYEGDLDTARPEINIFRLIFKTKNGASLQENNPFMFILNPGYFIGFYNTNAGKSLTSDFQDSPGDIHSLDRFISLRDGK